MIEDENEIFLKDEDDDERSIHHENDNMKPEYKRDQVSIGIVVYSNNPSTLCFRHFQTFKISNQLVSSL